LRRGKEHAAQKYFENETGRMELGRKTQKSSGECLRTIVEISIGICRIIVQRGQIWIQNVTLWILSIHGSVPDLMTQSVASFSAIVGFV
jgi:hypothetical protein